MLIRARRLDEHVEIAFSDDGIGMPEYIQRHVFDPFFTTKRSQGSTGLGLYIAYNLVTQQLGGTNCSPPRAWSGYRHLHDASPARTRPGGVGRHCRALHDIINSADKLRVLRQTQGICAQMSISRIGHLLDKVGLDP